MDFEQIQNELKKTMKKNRYQHVYRVSAVAEQIAEHYHLPVENIKIAGLIHDCAKDYTFTQLNSLINKYKISLNEVERHIPKIWHAYVGAEMAKDIFQIDNQEILDAIRYHSTASVRLGLMGKVLYIADKIEPNRKSIKTKELWQLIWKDINMAMLELLDRELRYLILKKLVIHPDTLEARNKIIIDRDF